ncbi:MAG TPA: hypothetical protein PKZ97_16275 [Azospirillaceae bacterium]|nr:hypothetical protein [Azospirillaceae bacterium]
MLTINHLTGFGVVAATAPPFLLVWNPADKSATIALSNADKTAAATSTGWSGVRGLHGFTAGGGGDPLNYSVVVNASGGYIDFGLATSAAALAGSGEGLVYYRGVNGLRSVNGVESAYAATFGAGDAIRAQIEPAAGQVRFFKNNADLGVAATGLVGQWFPWVRMYNAGDSVTAV